MAYVFNKTMGAMGEDDGKADIFGGQKFGLAGQPADQAQGGNVEKQKGGVIDGGGAALTGGGEAKPVEADAPNTAIVQKNLGKQKGPQALASATSGIQKAETDLQAEADAYKSAGPTDRSMSTEDMNAAIAGDEDATGTATGLIGQGEANKVEGFMPKTDTDVKQAFELSSPEGVKNAMAREAGPDYTKGMGAFDMMLLGRDTGFQKTMDAIRSGQANLSEKSQEYQSDLTDERQAAQQQELESAQEELRSYLGGQAGNIQSQAAQEAQIATNRDAAQRAQFAKDQEAQIRAEIIASNPELADYIGDASGNMDIGQYIRGGNYDASNFIDNDEAARFNRIQSLMGGTEVMQAGAAGQGLSIDDAYRNQLINEAQGLSQEKLFTPGSNLPDDPRVDAPGWNPNTDNDSIVSQVKREGYLDPRNPVRGAQAAARLGGRIADSVTPPDLKDLLFDQNKPSIPKMPTLNKILGGWG